jgi:hypothetical protein
VATGYEITLEDFRQLICCEPYRETIGALLKDWYAYEIVGHDAAAVIRSASTSLVSIELLHQKIQREPSKQRQLYNAAMGLWR